MKVRSRSPVMGEQSTGDGRLSHSIWSHEDDKRPVGLAYRLRQRTLAPHVASASKRMKPVRPHRRKCILAQPQRVAPGRSTGCITREWIDLPERQPVLHRERLVQLEEACLALVHGANGHLAVQCAATRRSANARRPPATTRPSAPCTSALMTRSPVGNSAAHQASSVVAQTSIRRRAPPVRSGCSGALRIVEERVRLVEAIEEEWENARLIREGHLVHRHVAEARHPLPQGGWR